MKKSLINIQEDDLHAYVDNQLSEEKRQAVEELMRNDPNIAEQIIQWQAQNKAIKNYFNQENFADIPNQLNIDKLQAKSKAKSKPITQNKPDATQSHNNRWYYSMAASLFLMIGSGLMGWFSHDLLQTAPQNSPLFSDMAISAYEVFSVEVLHPVEVKANKKDHLVKWLSKRINHPIKLPELENYGFKLLGGRLLSMQEGRAAAQFMFENEQGKRITWLVSKSPAYKDHAFFFKNEKNVNSYYWMDSNVAYSVSGKMDRDNLHKLSQGIYQQINDQESS